MRGYKARRACKAGGTIHARHREDKKTSIERYNKKRVAKLRNWRIQLHWPISVYHSRRWMPPGSISKVNCYVFGSTHFSPYPFVKPFVRIGVGTGGTIGISTISGGGLSKPITTRRSYTLAVLYTSHLSRSRACLRLSSPPRRRYSRIIVALIAR